MSAYMNVDQLTIKQKGVSRTPIRQKKYFRAIPNSAASSEAAGRS
jgi:hypothetical protein